MLAVHGQIEGGAALEVLPVRIGPLQLINIHINITTITQTEQLITN